MLGRFLNTNVTVHQFQIGSAVERPSGRNLPGVCNHAITLFDKSFYDLKTDADGGTSDNRDLARTGRYVLGRFHFDTLNTKARGITLEIRSEFPRLSSALFYSALMKCKIPEPRIHCAS